MDGDFSNLVIRASAGTGKTFQLSNRYLQLIGGGAPADHILATTFTRKAAGEILDRVIIRLAEACSDDGSRQELSDHVGDPSLSHDRCRELLANLIRQLHRLRISTLDSFFAQLARSFSLELGLPPGWRISEPLDDVRLRSEAVENILEQGERRDLLELVHLLTKGGASRGISSLVRETVNDLYGLFQETDKDAWNRLPRPKALGETELAAAIEDLQSVELPDLKSFRDARAADIDAASTEQWETFISKGLAGKVAAGEASYSRREIEPHVVEAYEKLVRHARAVLVGKVASQTEGAYQLLERFDTHYQSLKRERGALRFDDITHRLAIVSLGSVEQLAFRLDAGIDHLLLDEFQDTSLAQWQVLSPFARRSAETQLKRSFFCVGDAKQAIYGWRGGVPEIFDALGTVIKNLQDEPLNVSFRSSPPVIDTVNSVFSGMLRHGNLERYKSSVNRWCRRFPTHATARSDLPGYCLLQTASAADDGETQGEVTLRFAAQCIKELLQRAPGFDVGVLVRKNEVVGKLIYELQCLDIHASEEGGNPLTDSAAVETVLSLLRLADHPADTVSRFHLAHGPLSTYLELKDHMDDAAALRIARAVRRALLNDGYGPAIDRWYRQLSGSCSRRELSRLEKLVGVAYAYQGRATLRTDDFIAHVENERISDPTSASVRVMTIHQAKGLQFDVVVLPELDIDIVGQPNPFVVDRSDPLSPVQAVCRYVDVKTQGLLPMNVQKMFQADTDRRVDESLCMLYVALTRAKHSLHMIVAPSMETKKKKLHKKWSGLIRAALTDGENLAPETIAYQHGDPNWHTTQHDKRPRQGTLAPAPADRVTTTSIRLAPATPAARRGLEPTKPSQLEGGSVVQLSDRLGVSKSKAMQYGTLIHAWFEQITWLDDGRPEEAALRRVAERLGTPTGDIGPALDRFHAMLDLPATAELLSRVAYAIPRKLSLDANVADTLANSAVRLEVHNEQRIAVREGSAMLAGNIDRLVLMYDNGKILAADIIDYKTDTIDPLSETTIEAKVEFYRPQIEAYRNAVSKMLRLDTGRISARLLFVGPGVKARV